MKLKLLTAVLLSAGAIAAPSAVFAAAADLDSCCTPGDKDFPKVGGNLGNQNYSSLKQLNRANIKALGGAWLNHVNGGVADDNQSTPVVVDGVIYLETGGNVLAVDGQTGATKWKAEGKAGGTRRGAAVAKDLGLVYTLGTANSLVALDIATGEEKWRKSYTGVGNVAKVALVYHDKKLYIGTNDGTIGSGLMVDATNGTLLSNFWGVPQNPGDVGFDTWGGAPMNQRAGATPWLHPAVDPETNSVFWVFGNNRGGSSQNGSTRPG